MQMGGSLESPSRDHNYHQLWVLKLLNAAQVEATIVMAKMLLLSAALLTPHKASVQNVTQSTFRTRKLNREHDAQVLCRVRSAVPLIENSA
jgi:hypothetical protein